MSSQALLAPPALFQLSPPYEQYEAVPDLAALAPQDLPDAAILVVALDQPSHVWDEAPAVIPQLRARFPAAPVVLRVPHGTDEAELEWARRAGRLQVRAVLIEGELPRTRLRQVLTDASTLPEEVEQWLPLRLPNLVPEVGRMIATIVRLAPGYSEVSVLLGTLGHAERTVRTWFRRAEVPGPGKWLAAAHAVRAALRLQGEGSPLLTVAVECGYSDHSSLSRQSLRLFGVRPGAIRRTLGWEWLMDRWLGRAVRRAEGQAVRRAEGQAVRRSGGPAGGPGGGEK
jgi:AraC-like DNA-binding protein